MTRVFAAGLAVLLWAALFACRHQTEYTTVAAEPPSALLKVECDVPDARIYVDDFLAGTVEKARRGGIPVVPGVRRVEIRHQRYHSHFALVKLVKGGEVKVTASLREVLE